MNVNTCFAVYVSQFCDARQPITDTHATLYTFCRQLEDVFRNGLNGSIFCKYCTFVSNLSLALRAAFRYSYPEAPASALVINIGARRELFVDDFLIDLNRHNELCRLS